jgi:succinate dehydrogenase / fumarate reductase cytochrome b subunit
MRRRAARGRADLFGRDEFGENTRRCAPALPYRFRSPMSTPLQGKNRPEFRNIHVTQIIGYRLPAPGMVSILHRVSGALMFLLLALVIWLLQLSLASELSFLRLKEFAAQWWVKLVLVGLVWALLHHLLAGVRYLLLDLHVGIDKQASVNSALAVFAVSLPLTLLAALRIFGVF